MKVKFSISWVKVASKKKIFLLLYIFIWEPYLVQTLESLQKKILLMSSKILGKKI